MIDWQKVIDDKTTQKLRDGKDARVLAYFPGQDYPVIGVFMNCKGEWESVEWTESGGYAKGNPENPFDLIPPREVVDQIWVRIHNGHISVFSHNSSALARRNDGEPLIHHTYYSDGTVETEVVHD